MRLQTVIPLLTLQRNCLSLIFGIILHAIVRTGVMYAACGYNICAAVHMYA